MPAVITHPPEAGAYKYVLRRYDFDHSYPLIHQTYEEVCHSRSILFKGRQSCTIFIKTLNCRDLALKEGWKDETHEWFAFLEERTDEPAPAPKVKPPAVEKEDPKPAPAKTKSKK